MSYLEDVAKLKIPVDGEAEFVVEMKVFGPWALRMLRAAHRHLVNRRAIDFATNLMTPECETEWIAGLQAGPDRGTLPGACAPPSSP